MKKMISVLLALVLAIGLGCACAEGAGLPAYTYPGDDPVWAAVCNYMAENDFGFEVPEGGVLVPSPVIVKTETSADETEAKVYGDFWEFVYVLKDRTLECTAGGSFPGVMKLEKKDGAWTVVSLELAEDGENMADSIKALAGNDEELAKEIMNASSFDEGPEPQYRRAALIGYRDANKLEIEAYKDFGWDPVSLND